MISYIIIIIIYHYYLGMIEEMALNDKSRIDRLTKVVN